MLGVQFSLIIFFVFFSLVAVHFFLSFSCVSFFFSLLFYCLLASSVIYSPFSIFSLLLFYLSLFLLSFLIFVIFLLFLLLPLCFLLHLCVFFFLLYFFFSFLFINILLFFSSLPSLLHHLLFLLPFLLSSLFHFFQELLECSKHSFSIFLILSIITSSSVYVVHQLYINTLFLFLFIIRFIIYVRLSSIYLHLIILSYSFKSLYPIIS